MAESRSFKADIYVTLKRTVNDPQGLTIRGGLHALGFEAVSAVRAGKFIEVWLEAADQAAAQRQVEQMSDQLLANPSDRGFPRRTHARRRAGARSRGLSASISPPAGGRCHGVTEGGLPPASCHRRFSFLPPRGGDVTE